MEMIQIPFATALTLSHEESKHHHQQEERKRKEGREEAGPRQEKRWRKSEEEEQEEERRESEESEEKLLAPFAYLRQNPGKNVRGKLLAAFNVWLKIDQDKLDLVNEVVDMLHTGSLLIDDIEDDSPLRRGRPAAHIVHGVANTINCGNYVYFLALQKLIDQQIPELVSVYSQELLNLHRGQGNDIIWRESNACPSLNAYLEMISNKTGGLLRLALKLMQVFSSNKADFIPLMDLLGKHFQIRDDYVNLRSEEYMKEKGFCEDISEGKFSFPIIHSIRTSSSLSSSPSSTCSSPSSACSSPPSSPCSSLDHSVPSSPTLGFSLPSPHLSSVPLLSLPSSAPSFSFSSSSPCSTKLQSIMKLRTKDPQILREGLAEVEATHSIQFTVEYLLKLEEEMRQELKRLGGNIYLEKIVDELAKVYQADASLGKIVL